MDFVKIKNGTGFLCPLSANKYGIEFLSFKVSNNETKKVIFEVNAESSGDRNFTIDDAIENLDLGENSVRTICYTFDDEMLHAPSISSS